MYYRWLWIVHVGDDDDFYENFCCGSLALDTIKRACMYISLLCYRWLCISQRAGPRVKYAMGAIGNYAVSDIECAEMELFI